MTDLLKNPIFQDETKAREWLEARVWANGRVCPHCGNADQDKITKLEGKAHRPGVYQCNEPACRQQFTVTVNTVFERSKIPLTKWLAALFLMTASKKGVSAHQVHRMLGISYKSTWFLMHRLREAMRVRRTYATDGRGWRRGRSRRDLLLAAVKDVIQASRAGRDHKGNSEQPSDRCADRARRKFAASMSLWLPLTNVAPIVRANI